MDMMHITEPKKLDVGALIEDLLGLEAASLLKLSPADKGRGDGVLRGLGCFMRSVLETTLQVSEQADLTLYLVEAKTPDDVLANLASLLVYGLVPPLRRVAQFPFAPLSRAKRKSIGAVRIAPRLRAMSIDELIAEWEAKPKTRGPGREYNELKAFPTSAVEEIEAMLGVDAETLYLFRKVTGSGFELEARAVVGLERLTKDVLQQYKVMRERHTTAIRLMHRDDAKEAEIAEARAAQIATLLAAALHNDDDHEVYFLAARRHPLMRQTTLRETAKMIYRDYSEEALRGFELVCDGIVHFGHGNNHTLAETLLSDVAIECDPDLEAMPESVGWQLSLKVFSELLAPTSADSREMQQDHIKRKTMS